ncbi:geranylgeranyl transferase type-1 subunit beta-like [Magnolia sinica]|uniref:geranylgeranyl transferase type-1 subunit beta-like n=1 Tax=Magnolia sinica TaxID=86752 RepID=UPI00265B03C6|nr:geranylgeranyl transferase type-1 subunit beta-like [Magnolia sinica]XP_058100116.1 geranylgeranyl transferase type-1 subunit beta-like [Magnolia sinica]
MGFIKDDSPSKFISSSIINVPALLERSLEVQTIDGGFQGRTNKPSDTCYAFWVGGVLKILGAHHFFDKDALRAFLLSCQTPYSGFRKFPKQLPDLYHTYYGFCAFSLLDEPGIRPLCVELGTTDFTSGMWPSSANPKASTRIAAKC